MGWISRRVDLPFLEIAKLWLAAAAVRQNGELPVRFHHIDVDAA
jgi:hypothetical protein